MSFLRRIRVELACFALVFAVYALHLFVWGYDEITWFAHQSKEYRAKWLQYAWDWLRDTDTNAHLQMPGSRTATSSDTRWYFANNKSDAVPSGSGDEAAIRAVWANDTARLNK